MAFKMNPSSPLLRKAMGCASPAKNMNKGYGPMETSSPAKQRLGDLAGGAAGRAARVLQEGMEESAQGILPSVQEVKPAKKKKGSIKNTKKELSRGLSQELNRTKKKKPSIIEAEPIKKASAKKAEAKNKVEKKQLTPKQKALQKLRKAQGDNEVANIEKETSKVKKNSTKKRKQATRKDSQAERRTEKTKRLEARTERRKARRSPAKQTAKQKANLPKKVVDAIAAKQGKSPAKLDPMTIMAVANMAKNLKKKK